MKSPFSAAFAAIVPAMYYRMDAVLGPQHIFNHILAKLSVYATVFGAAYILPTPLIALCIQDQLQTKISSEARFLVHYDGLWRSETLAFLLGTDNFFSLVVALIAVGSLIGGNLILIVCGYVIYHLIATKTAELAVGNTLKYQTMLASVLTMVSFGNLFFFFFVLEGIHNKGNRERASLFRSFYIIYQI